jgi:hypothetical protein
MDASIVRLPLPAVAAAARPVPAVFLITKDPGCHDDHFPS